MLRTLPPAFVGVVTSRGEDLQLCVWVLTVSPCLRVVERTGLSGGEKAGGPGVLMADSKSGLRGHASEGEGEQPSFWNLQNQPHVGMC